MVRDDASAPTGPVRSKFNLASGSRTGGPVRRVPKVTASESPEDSPPQPTVAEPEVAPTAKVETEREAVVETGTVTASEASATPLEVAASDASGADPNAHRTHGEHSPRGSEPRERSPAAAAAVVEPATTSEAGTAEAPESTATSTDAPAPTGAPERSAEVPEAPGPDASETPSASSVGRPGPLVADQPFADGGAPLAWKGEFFQGPPVPAGPKFRVERPAVSLRFTAVAAQLAAGRAAPTEKVGEVLHSAEDRGLLWLPGRRTPGGYEIDHLAVTANGIWVVASEPAPTGRVEKRDIGDWFTPEPRLYIGDDDHTHTIRRVEAVDESLGRALKGTIAFDTPRYAVVSFVDSPPGWLERPFPFDDVWVTWSHHLVEPMLSTVSYSRDEMAEIAQVLDKVLDQPR